MQRTPLVELFTTFFRIGLTSFGMSILQNLKAMTLRRRFLSEQTFREGLALVQLYPGPIMVDLVAFIGYRNHGVLGALVATIGFLLPATALMMLASAAYLHYGNLPAVEIMLSGLNALVVGVVLNVTLDFVQKNLNSGVEAVLALSAFILGILHVDPLWAVLGGLILGAFVWRGTGESAPVVSPEIFLWSKLIVPGLVCAGLVIIAAWAAYHPSPLGDLVAVFMKIGAVAFGNGATILPVMQQAVVAEHHWLTASQFGTAIGLGQITPGPILNSATFVGYLVAGPSGALAATFAIFAPSFALTLIFTELFAHIRHLGAIQGAIRGKNGSICRTAGGDFAQPGTTGADAAHGVCPCVCGACGLALFEVGYDCRFGWRSACLGRAGLAGFDTWMMQHAGKGSDLCGEELK